MDNSSDTVKWIIPAKEIPRHFSPSGRGPNEAKDYAEWLRAQVFKGDNYKVVTEKTDTGITVTPFIKVNL